jgi:hypothetical protein
MLVGEEGIGKGTLTSWLIAEATKGGLDGDLKGQPIRVLIVGDEDAFEPIQGAKHLEVAAPEDPSPRRLSATGYGRADRPHSRRRQGAAIYNPKHVREKLKPIRRIAAACDVAVLGLLHPIKGKAVSFRDLMAGSHQFNAVSRSSGVRPVCARAPGARTKSLQSSAVAGPGGDPATVIPSWPADASLSASTGRGDGVLMRAEMLRETRLFRRFLTDCSISEVDAARQTDP